MKIIFAQGNPGQQYDRTRHNIGFYVIDQFAKKHDLKWSDKPKFNCQTTDVTVKGEKLILVKPTTFYNETGVCARKLVDFYNLNTAEDLLVIHDDLALPLGTIRTRPQGSDAGNNGIKSLNSHLGPDYHRIRIGVWNELRDQMDDADFVIGKFSKDEQEQLENDITPHVIRQIEEFGQGPLNPTSHRIQK